MKIDIDLPPGVYRNGTMLNARGRWCDSNLVRWYEGDVRPMRGWLAHSASLVVGAARAMLTWVDFGGAQWIGIGAQSHLYAMNRPGALYDITPAGLTPGRADAASGGGYGKGLYGVGAYGTPRSDTTLIQDATVWTLDTFGQYLVGTNADDGKLYEWQLNTGTKAAVLSAAPTNCRAVFVTPERFIFALGASGNPRRIQWPDRQTDNIWTPTASNQAGSFDVQSQGRLMCGQRALGGSLIWTDLEVFFASYIGYPDVYSIDRVGSDCGIISQAAAASTGTLTAWMGRDSFWTYNGYVQPLASDVGDYVFGDLNRAQQSKIWAINNPAFGEITWFYPSGSSNEVDSYVRWNYREGHWAVGKLARTAGAAQGAFSVPLMVDPAGKVWEHETGWNYGSAGMPFAETGPYVMDDGRVFEGSSMIPDGLAPGQVQVTVFGRMYPTTDPDHPEETYGPYLAENPTDVRFSAAEARFRFTGTAIGDWRLGKFKFVGQPGSER